MSERSAPDGRRFAALHIDPIEPPPSRWSMPSEGPIDETDIVAVGADLEPGTLLAAYRTGLFPMPFDRRRIAWFSPDPRGVLPLDGMHVSRSLRRSMRDFDYSMNTAFREVMIGCADPSRPSGWIDDAFIEAYHQLHRLGWAHSVEVRDAHGSLVGGLYGLRIGGFFAGESMFHRATDASKAALAHLVEWLNETGGMLLDVQWATQHLASLGVIEVPRVEYLELLRAAIDPHRPEK